MSEKIKASNINWKAIALWLVVLWIAITAGVYSLRHNLTDLELAGQIGDMFGAASALFSGIAIIGLLYTILQQREDLDMQRDELRLTRNEHARSAEAQQKASDILEISSRISAISSMLEDTNKQIELIRGDAIINDILSQQGITLTGLYQIREDLIQQLYCYYKSYPPFNDPSLEGL